MEKYNESYIGQKKNFLTVEGIVWDKTTGKKRFRCRCDCGTVKDIKPTYWDNGKTKSCGCYANSLKKNVTPDVARIRRIYRCMMARCYDGHNRAYKYYGMRGISICQEWLEDPEKFVEWSLENGYANDLSIDRKNNDGNYEPENCRWADDKTQASNKRMRYTAKIYKFNGEMVSVNDLCEKLPLDRRTLTRALREGKHPQGAVFAAYRERKRKDGKTYGRKEG